MTLNVKPRYRNQVAYLFPGQGAQAVGMGRELYERSPVARSVFEEVDSALGRPLTRVLFEGPEDELRQTVNAQPAIMAVSLACALAIGRLVLGRVAGRWRGLVGRGLLGGLVGVGLGELRRRGRLSERRRPREREHDDQGDADGGSGHGRPLARFRGSGRRLLPGKQSPKWVTVGRRSGTQPFTPPAVSPPTRWR